MAGPFIERQFELGESATVVARLFKPERHDVDYSCSYEIAWPDRTRSFAIHGIDEVQALVLALNIVHAELLSSPEGKRGDLRWLGSTDLGLPPI